ncbi:MAG: restriction endonuclease subunit S [Methylobacter sp.]|nr:restriction endonuclease subunit S [Methylobacter sp.]
MKYEAYPEYKDSGVEWLGDIPDHWVVVRLKNILQCRITDGPHTTPVFVDEGVPFLSVDGIQDGELKFDRCRYISEINHAEYRMKALPKRNDLLMGKAASTGKIARVKVDFEFSIWSPLALIRLDCTESNPTFFEQSLKSPIVQAQIENLCTANTQKNISMDDIPKLILTRPPLEEQTKIANFLDHETAKIDTLIEKQQQLIQLLKEKRQAVISHAVTKGLNPNAPMRDSGVEWWSEVPEHWVVAKLSFRYEVQLGKMLDDKKIKGNYLGAYLRNTDVQWDSINDENLPMMDFRPEEHDRYSVIKGDLIVCEGGEIGRCAIWKKDEPCFYQKALHRLRPLNPSKDNTRFMFYVLFDAVHQERFISGAGKSTIAHLPAEIFRQFRFPYPPHNEQLAISDFLDKQKAKYDLLELRAEQQIVILQERRTALISAAVTGKIDVRNFK